MSEMASLELIPAASMGFAEHALLITKANPLRSCSILAVQANGKSVITVEGLGNEDGTTSLLQMPFVMPMRCSVVTVFQGMLISAHTLLERNLIEYRTY